MKNSYITHRQIFLINFLRNKKATYEEVRDYLERYLDIEDYGKRMFLRDIHEISTSFGIAIECNRKDRNTYSITSDEDSNRIGEYAMDSFLIYSAFSSNTNMERFIQVDSRKPLGLNLLLPILKAIQNKHCLSFYYQKYDEDQPMLRNVEPYGLKESLGRWYLIAFCLERQDFRVFGLDRISEMANGKKYKSRNKDVFSMFEHSFGVFTSKEEPEQVILSFCPYKGKYIKSFPLHSSQEILQDDEQELRIKLCIHITHDFFIEILKHTGDVRIMAPISLRSRYLDFLRMGIDKNRVNLHDI